MVFTYIFIFASVILGFEVKGTSGNLTDLRTEERMEIDFLTDEYQNYECNSSVVLQAG
jgi:hypothetical protein